MGMKSYEIYRKFSYTIDDEQQKAKSLAEENLNSFEALYNGIYHEKNSDCLIKKKVTASL